MLIGYDEFNEIGFIKLIFVYENEQKKDVGPVDLLTLLNGVNEEVNSVINAIIVVFYLRVRMLLLSEVMS